jgi:hypothetical protein
LQPRLWFNPPVLRLHDSISLIVGLLTSDLSRAILAEVLNAAAQLGTLRRGHDFARATKFDLASRAVELRRHFAMSQTTAAPPMAFRPVFQNSVL